MKWFNICILFWCTSVFAADVIVCDPANPLVPNAVIRFQRSDPPTNEPNHLIWSAPHSAMTQEEAIRMNQLRSQLDLLQGVSYRYWICLDTNPIDGVLDSVREMTQAEKNALDAPEIAEAQRQAAFETEITTNDLCTATLSEIESRIDAEVANIQAQLDATPNTVAGVKAHLRNQLYPKLGAVFKKVGKCIRARAR